MQPAYLYKYCSYTNPFHLELLFLNYIYFCSFEKLNDPFEGNFYTRLDLVPNEQLKEFLKQLLEHQGIKISDPKLEIYLDTQKEYFKNPEKIRENAYEVYKKFIGVFSVSTDPNNILMWSHYADNHKGFCIRFNRENAIPWFEEKNKQENF